MSVDSVKNREKIKSLKTVDICGNCYYRSPYTQWCFRDSIQAWVAVDETCDYHENKIEKEKQREENLRKKQAEVVAMYEKQGLKTFKSFSKKPSIASGKELPTAEIVGEE